MGNYDKIHSEFIAKLRTLSYIPQQEARKYNRPQASYMPEEQRNLTKPGEGDDPTQWFNYYKAIKEQGDQHIARMLLSRGLRYPMSDARKEHFKNLIGITVETLPPEYKEIVKKQVGKDLSELTPQEKKSIIEGLKQSIPEDKWDSLIDVDVNQLKPISKENMRELEDKKKERINKGMETYELALPYKTKIFGTLTLAQILQEAKAMDSDNPFADYQGKKTLFNNPEEYVKELEDIRRVVPDDKIQMPADFFPATVPAVGDMSFLDIYKFEKRTRSKQRYWAKMQEKKGLTKGKGQGKGQGQDSGEGSSEAQKVPERIEPTEKQVQLFNGVTPIFEPEKWANMFREAREALKAQDSELYNKVMNPKARKNLDKDERDNYMRFINKYMKGKGYAPAYTREGNPSGEYWWKEAIEAGANLS